MTLNIERYYQEKDSVLNTDTFDRDRFVRMVNKSPNLGDLIQNHSEGNPDFPALMGDVWASLYKTKPALKSFEEEESSSEEWTSPINYPLIKRLMSEDAFHDMKTVTTLDEITSAIGSMRVSDMIEEWLYQQMEENQELKNQMDNYIQQKEQGIEPSQVDSEKLQAIIEGQVEQNGDQFGKILVQAKEGAKEAKDNLKSLFGSAGNQDGDLEEVPLSDKIALAEKISMDKSFKKIAEWAGHFKAIARKKQKSKHKDSVERSGVTLGSDLERLLPQELAMFSAPSTKKDFMRRYVEGQTMMYSPKGKESLGKGPILLCLDQSGSMKSLDPQSKGFSLALAMIARKQKRDFVMICFSNNVQRVFDFPKGKISISDLVEMATFFAGGGTQYVPPLREAMKMIAERSHLKKADIVFVTDGNPEDAYYVEKKITPEIKEFQKQYETQVLSLLIGSQVSQQHVKNFSNKVLLASDFTSEDATDIFSL